MRGADIGSDHELLKCKLRIKLKKYKIVTDTSRKRFDTTKLQRPEVRKAFSIELKNRFQLLDELEDIETFWEGITKCYKETATNTLGFKGRGQKLWISNESWKLVDERGKLKERTNNSRSERVKKNLHVLTSTVTKTRSYSEHAFIRSTMSTKRKAQSNDGSEGKRSKSSSSVGQSVTTGSPFEDLSYISWSAADVATKLKAQGLPEAAEKLKAQNVSGDELDMITEQRLTEYGIENGGDRLKVLKFIRDLTTQHDKKIFNDPVHGHIEMHPLCVKIIDTPQFQRLRDLKQIGACYFVYPGASNNRFEHCIGVCHLAGKLTRTLQKRQPGLDITNKDILCVEIAGLCHDLGHGPFSHLFDSKFIPTVRPELQWKHEEGSVMMFNFLRNDNDLEQEFKKYGLNDNDIAFIVEQIEGPKERNNGEWPYKGREKAKEYLYEVVANKRNGIDVDKWDYFARDCHGLGIQNTFDHNRFMKFARVIQVDDSLQICSRDKEAETLYSMFQIRATLHRRAYQHRVSNAVQAMIVDALISADKTELIPKKDGSLIKISDCITCPEAYTKLSDSIFHVILMSIDQNLAKARAILERVLHRKLYRCVGETNPKQTTSEDQIKELRKKIMSYILRRPGNKLKESDLYIDIVSLDYGSTTKNPINNVCFYNKNNVDKAIYINQEKVSVMLTNVFAEHIIRLFYKQTDLEGSKNASSYFNQWCAVHGYLQQTRIPDDMTET
ncbi:SAMHD1 [Mytilus coruscus]|uniref:Deoxynucleoside triphosphate triphosphohydrolase SAMHD1 n=1 Tax=Mytilus coruscus TaxID=42192 RepID=A0A6J8CJK6_MYTCO|nr:SAMHD1 [Mytilus coruscus]